MSQTRPPAAAIPGRPGRRAFTLVEVLVTTVIIMVLSTLALSGMAAARRRVKIDATRNTIRKIHEIVMPQYESYQRRRVPAGGTAGFVSGTSAIANARSRLVAIRQMMVYELPDSWSDVRDSVTTISSGTNPPLFAQTGPVFAYAATKAAVGPAVVTAGGAATDSAECLYLIVARSGFEPESAANFRSDEVGDTDKDGVPEFLDAWNRPIGFIRWAAGFSPASPVQKADATNFHDPLDPMRVDSNGYALIPLIVSAGPDGVAGLAPSTGWQPANSTNLQSIVTTGSSIGMPASTGGNLDNITNHDLVTK